MPVQEEIRPQTRIGRRKEIVFNEVDDQVMALDAQAGYCYSLSGPGNRIWELLATPQTVAALCAQLEQEYSVDPATCLADVTTWIAELCDAGLVAATNQAHA